MLDVRNGFRVTRKNDWLVIKHQSTIDSNSHNQWTLILTSSTKMSQTVKEEMFVITDIFEFRLGYKHHCKIALKMRHKISYAMDNIDIARYCPTWCRVQTVNFIKQCLIQLWWGCTHIASLLFTLDEMEDLPCTSKPCQWNQPSKRKKDSRSITDEDTLKVKKKRNKKANIM